MAVIKVGTLLGSRHSVLIGCPIEHVGCQAVIYVTLAVRLNIWHCEVLLNVLTLTLYAHV